MTPRNARSYAIALVLAVSGAALAGCVQAPEEAAGPTDGDVAEFVIIDGAPYECDAFEIVDPPEEGCPEYELEEDAEPEDLAGAENVTSEDGRVTIGGVEYACDETLRVDVGEPEPCEEYEPVEA